MQRCIDGSPEWAPLPQTERGDAGSSAGSPASASRAGAHPIPTELHHEWPADERDSTREGLGGGASTRSTG